MFLKSLQFSMGEKSPKNTVENCQNVLVIQSDSPNAYSDLFCESVSTLPLWWANGAGNFKGIFFNCVYEENGKEYQVVTTAKEDITTGEFQLVKEWFAKGEKVNLTMPKELLQATHKATRGNSFRYFSNGCEFPCLWGDMRVNENFFRSFFALKYSRNSEDALQYFNGLKNVEIGSGKNLFLCKDALGNFLVIHKTEFGEEDFTPYLAASDKTLFNFLCYLNVNDFYGRLVRKLEVERGENLPFFRSPLFLFNLFNTFPMDLDLELALNSVAELLNCTVVLFVNGYEGEILRKRYSGLQIIKQN